MGFLDDLMGDEGRQQQLKDFIGRVEQGPPHEGFTDQEALDRHEQIASRLSPDEYRQAAEQAVSRLSPDERAQLGQQLIEQARGQGLQASTGEQDTSTPGGLAGLMAGLQQQGGLGSLLGGSGGAAGILANPLAKAALGGIAAMAAKQALGRLRR
jgi:hypothetical protein